MTFTPRELVIDGTEKKSGTSHLGYLVRIDQHEVYLPHAQFVCLWTLAQAQYGKWTHGSNLCNPQRLTSGYLWRLRAIIQEDTGTDWQVYENDRHAHYRLFIAPSCKVSINPNLRLTGEGRIAA